MIEENSLLKSLNPRQREAVEAVDGPLLILAGPGSGKTRVITHRIAYLMRSAGVSPFNIMAVTFTNKAANEMKERLKHLVPQGTDLLSMGTFHSICVRILRRDGLPVRLERNFVIYDDGDQVDVVKGILKDMNLDEKQHPPRGILARISNAKSELIDAKTYAAGASSYMEEVVARVYRLYDERMQLAHAVDFDDLIGLTVRLFRENPGVLIRYQDRYSHFMVDEFQDTNIAQYTFIKLLAQRDRNLAVVGDEDQSIYSWRAADIRNIWRFEEDFPERRVIVLEQNYRSTKTILQSARAVIAANLQRKEKNLWTSNDQGTPITVFEAYNEQEEAQYVVSEIERLIARGLVKARECAVLYRTNAQSRVLEESFIRRGLPYQLIGGTRFYERKEIKDVLAYLRLLYNPFDNISLRRVINVPNRGIGERSVGMLESLASSHGRSMYETLRLLRGTEPEQVSMDGTAPPKKRKRNGDQGNRALGAEIDSPFNARTEQALLDFLTLIEDFQRASLELTVSELLDYVLTRSGYSDYIKDGTEEGEERWENIRELSTVAADFDGLEPRVGLSAFLEEVALVADVDNYNKDEDAVTLITFHAAKGLEFQVVFMVGMEEGLTPHSRSLDNPQQMEEERRLAYVGMTRAGERLYMIYTFKRTLYGNAIATKPSRFLEDLPRELVRGRDTATPARGVGTTRPGVERDRRDASWDVTTPRGFTPTAPPAANTPRTTTFTKGDKVRHPKFGDGIVVDIKINQNDEEVSVLFSGTVGMKRLAVSFANLQKI